MTEPLIKLPSVELRELKEAIELFKEDLAQTKGNLAKTKEELHQAKEDLVQSKKDLIQKDAYIKELEQKLAALQS